MVVRFGKPRGVLCGVKALQLRGSWGGGACALACSGAMLLGNYSHGLSTRRPETPPSEAQSWRGLDLKPFRAAYLTESQPTSEKHAKPPKTTPLASRYIDNSKPSRTSTPCKSSHSATSSAARPSPAPARLGSQVSGGLRAANRVLCGDVTSCPKCPKCPNLWYSARLWQSGMYVE